MLNEKLAIVVGHEDAEVFFNAKDQEYQVRKPRGATMAPPYSYVSEYTFYTVLAAVMSAQLRNRSVEHAVFFRDGIGIIGAYQKAKVYGSSAIIELHFNAVDNPNVKGTEVLYGDIPHSKELASYVHHEICGVFSRHSAGGDRGTRHTPATARGGRSLNNGTGIPSVLVEPFFGSNVVDAEAALMHFQALGESIIEGFMKWLLSKHE